MDPEALGALAGRVVRGSGTDTRVDLVRDTRVETDRRRLERVLGNLVANAHRHGRAPVVLTVDGPVITVRDHGDGYPEYLLAHGPQRFRTEGGTKGHGLGLTIALGQAEVLGARLEFTNPPGGGGAGDPDPALSSPDGPPGGAGGSPMAQCGGRSRTGRS